MSERKMKIIAGCKTYGTTDLELGNICSDPECGTCSNFLRIFKESVDKQAEELKNQDCTIPKLDPEKRVKYERPKGIRPTKEEIREAAEYVFRNYKE